jgi:hypothetical protein
MLIEREKILELFGKTNEQVVPDDQSKPGAM